MTQTIGPNHKPTLITSSQSTEFRLFTKLWTKAICEFLALFWDDEIDSYQFRRNSFQNIGFLVSLEMLKGWCANQILNLLLFCSLRSWIKQKYYPGIDSAYTLSEHVNVSSLGRNGSITQHTCHDIETSRRWSSERERQISLLIL